MTALRSGQTVARQFTRFAAVGAVGTLVHYIVLLILVEAFSIGPVVASSAGAACGAVVNYILNYHFTFASNKSHMITAPLFLTIAVTGFVWNGVLMSMFVHVMSKSYLLAQVFATGLVLVWNFALNRLLTFRE